MSRTTESRQVIGDLYDRLTKKIEYGRGVHLSSVELDLLVVTGAYAAVLEAAAREAYRSSRNRLEEAGINLSFLDRVGHDTVPLPVVDLMPASTDEEPPSTIFTPKMLAARWGVGLTHVHARIKSGELRAFKIGARLYRVRRDALEEYERAKGISPQIM